MKGCSQTVTTNVSEKEEQTRILTSSQSNSLAPQLPSSSSEGSMRTGTSGRRGGETDLTTLFLSRRKFRIHGKCEVSREMRVVANRRREVYGDRHLAYWYHLKWKWGVGTYSYLLHFHCPWRCWCDSNRCTKRGNKLQCECLHCRKYHNQ